MPDLKVQPGSIKISQCRILKQATNTATDILSIVDSVIIYEDLFSPFITGKLQIRDTLDFLNQSGLYGPDLLKLRIEPPELDKKFWIDDIFVIYKIADRIAVGERMQTYSIYFASVELMRDVNSPISKKFEGSCVDIITKIATTYLNTDKKINSDETGNRLTYISNFWNPSKNFSYIADHAYDAKLDSTFLFYENRDGFNFKTVSSLMDSSNKAIMKFGSSNYSGVIGGSDTANSGNVTRDMSQEYSNILGFRVDLTYDFIKDYLDGALLSKLYSNDPITKKIRWGTYSSIDKPSILNNNHLYPDSIINALNPIIGNINRSYGVFEKAEYSNYAHIQKRTGIIRSLQSSKVEIDVYGQTIYTVGRKIHLNMSQMRQIIKSDTGDELVDKLYSGNYIITAISHQFMRDGYRCTMELSKESTLLR